WQKGTRYLFRRSRTTRGFADGISRLVMRPAGSGALHGPPGIFVFRATPESFVPLQARETVIKTHLSAPWPSAVNGVMVRANSTSANVWKMHHSEERRVGKGGRW